jgi:hypothetical protein
VLDLHSQILQALVRFTLFSFQNINEEQCLGSIYFLLFIAASKQRVAFMDMAVSTIAEICRVIRAPRAGK